SKTRCPTSACSRPAGGVCRASSLMSAPATKAFSPAPVMTIARTSWSRLNSSAARSSSSSVAVFSAFRTLGRLMVTVATRASRSRRRLSKGMKRLNYIGIEGFLFRKPRSQWERIHQPTEHDRGDHEPAEEQPAKPKLIADLVLGDEREG